jgi:putative transposase
VSILVEETIEPLSKIDKAIGIDLGLENFLIDSDGNKIKPLRVLKKHLIRLKLLQRRLSKKQKGSKNYEKARLKVAKLHQKITNIRLDFLHKLSTKLIRENQTICIEDLNVKGLVKNHKLARSISDASWSKFIELLEYKARWYGRTISKVDRFYPSSQICSGCGTRGSKKPLNIRNWTCTKCGTNHDRDINAAKNILAAGVAVLACGENISLKTLMSSKQSSTKQETQKNFNFE